MRKGHGEKKRGTAWNLPWKHHHKRRKKVSCCRVMMWFVQVESWEVNIVGRREGLTEEREIERLRVRRGENISSTIYRHQLRVKEYSTGLKIVI